MNKYIVMLAVLALSVNINAAQGTDALATAHTKAVVEKSPAVVKTEKPAVADKKVAVVTKEATVVVKKVAVAPKKTTPVVITKAAVVAKGWVLLGNNMPIGNRTLRAVQWSEEIDRDKFEQCLAVLISSWASLVNEEEKSKISFSVAKESMGMYLKTDGTKMTRAQAAQFSREASDRIEKFEKAVAKASKAYDKIFLGNGIANEVFLADAETVLRRLDWQAEFLQKKVAEEALRVTGKKKVDVSVLTAARTNAVSKWIDDIVFVR